MKTKTIFGALFVAAMSMTPAGASTYLFPFTTPPGDVGSSSHSYTVTAGSSSATITASVLVSSGSTPDLYDKTGGTDENGLGTSNNADHEIIPGQAIVLDFSQISNITSIGIQMGSVQAASMDDWEIYGSNTKPTSVSSPGTVLLGGVQTSDQELTGTFVNVPATYKYLTIEVPVVAGCSPNVLLGAVDVVTAPEPGTWILLGFGLIGLVFGRKLLRS